MTVTDKKAADGALIKRPAVLGVGAATFTAVSLGAVAVAPTIGNDIAWLATTATSTGEGIGTVAGVTVGLAAYGITALSTKSHWTQQTATKCGVVDTSQSEQKYGNYGSWTVYHCEHDGTGRRSALRGMGVRALAIGGGAALVSGVAAHLGFEQGMSALIENLSTGIAVAGGVTTAGSVLRSGRPPIRADVTE